MRRHGKLWPLIGLPDAVIAFAWLSIWLLWPSSAVRRLPRPMPAPKAAFADFGGDEGQPYRMPIQWLRSWNSVVTPPEDEELPELGTQRRATAAKLLERPYRPSPVLAFEAACGYSALSTSGSGAYVPPWREPPVFSVPPDPSMKLVVEPSSALTRMGFLAPDVETAASAITNKPWFVVIGVDINEGGRVENAFIELSADDPVVNAAMVRAVGKGYVVRPGAECSGYVAVNFGSR